METKAFFIYSFFFIFDVISAETTDLGSCYRIAPGMLAGVVLSDIVLTIAIISVTYFCASKRRVKKENAEKVYMNVRANCKQ